MVIKKVKEKSLNQHKRRRNRWWRAFKAIKNGIGIYGEKLVLLECLVELKTIKYWRWNLIICY